MEDLHFSARAHDRILKVARTIADLAAAGKIEEGHLVGLSNIGPWTARFGCN
jgi:magnesium chelatase family protein